jgi:hypothetical protein
MLCSTIPDLTASRASYGMGTIQHTETGSELNFCKRSKVNPVDVAIAIRAKILDSCID